MGVAAYSSALNVVPAPAAGTGSMGYAVCNPANGGFVVANTANRAGGAVEIAGVALENFVANTQFRVATSGYIPADVIGSLTGTGRYVSVDANGKLYRTGIVSSDTVGIYNTADGSVFVSIDYQFGGGAANASSIQSVPVATSSASRSSVLAGDGSYLRTRPGVLNVLDFLPTGTNPATVGDWIQYLDAMVLASSPGQTLYLPKIAGTSINASYPISRTWRIFTDDEHGGNRHLAVVMENGRGLGYLDNCITANFSDIVGTTANIDFVGSGTGAFRMMRLTGCTGALKSLESELLGCQVHVWGSTTAANVCQGALCKIESDGVIWINAPSTSTAIDSSGTVCWRIQRCAIEWGVFAGIVQGLSIVVGAGQDLWTMFHDTQPNGANAAVSASRYAQNVHISNGGGTGIYHEGVAFAKNIVPLPTSALYSTGVYSGVTVPQPYLPASNSEASYDLVTIEYGPRATAIAGYSGNGQSEQHHFTRLAVNFVQCAWDTTHTFNASSAYNQAHANFTDIRVGTVYDTIFDTANAARPINVDLVTGESGSGCRLIRYKGTAPLPLRMSRVYMSYYGTGIVKEHPTGELMTLTSRCSIQATDVGVYLSNDSATWTIYCNANTNYVLENFSVVGTTARTSRPAQKTAGRFGPIFYSDGDKFRLIANGVDQTVAITKADVDAACTARFGSYSSNRNELRWMEFALWVESKFTGVRCWGKWDSSEMTLLSTTGNLDVQAPAAGVDLNAKIGFAVGAVAPTAQSQLSKDTLGWLEMGAGVTDCEVTFVPTAYTWGSGTSVQYPIPSFRSRHYGTTHLVKGDVYPKVMALKMNTGDGTTVTFTFATAKSKLDGTTSLPYQNEVDTNYLAEPFLIDWSASCAAGALTRLAGLTKTQNSVSFNVSADPGGAAQWALWGLRVTR